MYLKSLTDILCMDSVKDEITVPIIYEGRAAKVLSDNDKLKEIDEFYKLMNQQGASEYQIEKSKKTNSKISYNFR